MEETTLSREARCDRFTSQTPGRRDVPRRPRHHLGDPLRDLGAPGHPRLVEQRPDEQPEDDEQRIEIAFARGRFRGSNAACLIVAVLYILTIVGALFAAFTPGNQRGTSIGQVVIAIIVLALLYSGRANEFFNRSKAPTV